MTRSDNVSPARGRMGVRYRDTDGRAAINCGVATKMKRRICRFRAKLPTSVASSLSALSAIDVRDLPRALHERSGTYVVSPL